MPVTRAQLTTHQEPRVLPKQISFPARGSPDCPDGRASLFHVRDFAFVVSGIHKVLFSPFLQPVRVPLNGSPVLKKTYLSNTCISELRCVVPAQQAEFSEWKPFHMQIQNSI